MADPNQSHSLVEWLIGLAASFATFLVTLFGSRRQHKLRPGEPLRLRSGEPVAEVVETLRGQVTQLEGKHRDLVKEFEDHLDVATPEIESVHKLNALIPVLARRLDEGERRLQNLEDGQNALTASVARIEGALGALPDVIASRLGVRNHK